MKASFSKLCRLNGMSTAILEWVSGLDAIALMERVGEGAFVVDICSQNAMTPEYIRAAADEVLYLR